MHVHNQGQQKENGSGRALNLCAFVCGMIDAVEADARSKTNIVKSLRVNFLNMQCCYVS